MTIETRLAEIRARADAATEGPWEWEGESREEWPQGENSLIARQGTGDLVLCAWGYDAYGITVDEADAEFIAASRTDLPALLAAVEAVRELHAPVEGILGDEFCDHCWDQDDWAEVMAVRYPCPTVQAITTALEVQG